MRIVKAYFKDLGAHPVLCAIMLFCIVMAIVKFVHGATPDACEIACGPVFTQCLLDAGTSPETPDPRVERECRRYTESTCIRPCRRQR